MTVLTIVFIGTYSWGIYRLYFDRWSWTEIFTDRERWLVRGFTAGPAVLLVAGWNGIWPISLIFVVLAFVITAPPLAANAGVVQGLALVMAILVAAGVDLSLVASVLAFSAVFGLMVASQMRQSGEMGKMIEARYSERRMAAAEERLRITRDLHDVLGHTLSLITLKSELASALADKDPARAQREMREVETIARSAMADVRRTVTAERQPILAAELADARQLLAAAGMSLEVHGAADELPGDAATLFAWGVREGVTNVVRHSRARHCTISLKQDGNRAVLTVMDDGAGADIPGSRPGSGLIGLRERAEQAGGTMAFETRPDRAGHVLTLTVPVTERD